MDTVNVAFIGAGGMANNVHYPSVDQCPDANLIAICDLDENRLNATADKYGVEKRYSDYHEMFDREPDIDAVYVIMPPMPLKDIVPDCFAAGKHVFIEKPPGTVSEETLLMAEAAERAGKKSMVAFNRRFSPVIAESKRRIDEAGGPSQAMAEFHKNMVGERPYYGLSILTCDVIHVVDCLRYFLGDAVEVHSDVQQYDDDWDNMFNALIKFDSGCVGLLSACRVAGGRYERFELHGKGISSYIRAPQEAEIWTSDKDCELLKGEQLAGTEDNRITYGFYGETCHFIDCIRNDEEPLTNFRDALKSIQLCEWIQYGRPRT
ncbi:MAG: Gfo/Idh/MocA family protein [Armatimonadota bacterium]